MYIASCGVCWLPSKETAAGTGKVTGKAKGSRERSGAYRLTRAYLVRLSVTIKRIALAALTLGRALSLHVHAQVVAAPDGSAHRPTVIARRSAYDTFARPCVS